jgi:hypothetical protein
MTSALTRKRLALLLTPLLIGASHASHACADHEQHGASAECKAARLSAWFERQRQLTEGDTNPFVKPAEPAQCKMEKVASNDATTKR